MSNMTVGIASSHAYGMGGGFQALKWHIMALKELGYEVVFFTRNKVHPFVYEAVLRGVRVMHYKSGVEAHFGTFINIDHFAWAQPLAENNIAHVFFPQNPRNPPPEGVRLYANSKYTASYIDYYWNRKAEVLYIPIDPQMREDPKQPTILHVSRFTAPSVWADKAHRQLIQVFKMYYRELQGWRLVIAGSLDIDGGDYLNELQVAASGFPIEFVVHPTTPEMISLYAQASIYWHATGISIPAVPSSQEHLGLAPLEAQAAGAVPVVYNSGGMPEVVLANQTGFLVDEAREIGVRTVALVNEPQMWAAMQQAGKRWASAWQDYEHFKMRVLLMMAGIHSDDLLPNIAPLQHITGDVTIVIPHAGSPTIGDCITALVNTVGDAKIVVIDNGGKFETTAENVKVMRPETNLGFAGSYKWAFEQGIIATPYVLVMNDDVIALHRGWLELMLAEMSDPMVGAVGPKLLFPDGRLQHAGGEIDFHRPDVGFHRYYGQPDGLHASQKIECAFVTGACLLTRLDYLKYLYEDWLLGGLGYEDTNLCTSIYKIEKKKVLYQPASVLAHLEGSTRRGDATNDDRTARNRAAFVERWSSNV